MKVSKKNAVILVLSGITGIVLAWTFQIVNQPDYLRNARQEDLVRILDELTTREDDLSREVRRLELLAIELQRGNEEAVIRDLQDREIALQVLSGTVAVAGPGIELTIADPEIMVGATVFFDLINELRDAGAEAISVNDARVVANTGISEITGGLQVGDRAVLPTYRVKVIGNATTITTALKIPGGILDVLKAAGAITSVQEFEDLEIKGTVSPRPLVNAEPLD
ncbi:MAG: DUF881 domain-containing protein [Actinobacteria bacterium]|nr:DUF881 domain-containing protein [Actinomycetota bacterium]